MKRYLYRLYFSDTIIIDIDINTVFTSLATLLRPEIKLLLNIKVKYCIVGMFGFGYNDIQ